MKWTNIALVLLVAAPLSMAAEQLVLVDQYVDGEDGITGLSAGNHSLAISPDGRHIFAAGGHFAFSSEPNRGSLVVFDRNAADGRLTHLQSIVHGIDISLMVAAAETAVSPDGRHVYVAANTTSFFGGRYIVFDRSPDTGLLTEIAAYNGGVLNRAIAISPDGNSVYIGGGHGLLSLARAANGTLSAIPNSEEPGSFEVDDIAMSPDGMNLYTAGSRCPSGSSCFPLIYGVVPMTRDAVTGALVAGNPIEGPELALARRLALSADGRYLYVSGAGITVFERDAADGALTFSAHLPGVAGGNVDKLPVSGDGERLFVNGVLVDSSTPTAMQVVDDIFDDVGFGPSGQAANSGFNHLYSFGWDGPTESYILSLFRLDGRPIPDGDGDGVPDADDNCPAVANPAQANHDGDEEGDACDDDDDNDGRPDLQDAFPLDPDETDDTDGDGTGNNADTDDDNDGLSDDDEGNLYGTNPLKRDTDDDGLDDGDEVDLGLDPLDPTDCPIDLCPPSNSVLKWILLFATPQDPAP